MTVPGEAAGYSDPRSFTFHRGGLSRSGPIPRELRAIPELDHLVYAVPDLGEAVASFRAALGVAPLEGGRHEGLGTRNAILPLEGGVYVEVISADPEAPAPAGPRPFGIDALAGRSRLVTWAARTEDLDARAAAARAAGYDPGTVLPMSRETPAGGRLAWKLAVRPDPPGGGAVPFLIDWLDAPHPSRMEPARCRLESFEAVVRDADAVRAALRALGLEAALAVRAGEATVLRARIAGPAGGLELSG